MKKNLNKLATLALTGILMTGMSFGALAENDAPNGVNTTGGEELILIKELAVLDVDSNYQASAPAIQYSYTWETVTEDELGTVYDLSGDNDRIQSDLTKRKVGTGTPTIDAEAFVATEKAINDKVNKNIKINFSGVTFEEAGVYRYKLVEGGYTASNGFDYSSSIEVSNEKSRYIDVYVGYVNGNLKITGYVVSLVEGGKKTPGYEVEIKEDGTDVTFGDKYSTYDLAVNKFVTGTLGEKTKDFAFSATVPVPDGSTYNYANTYDASQNGEKSETSISTTLTDKKTFEIKGVPFNKKVTVSESDYTSNGYKTYLAVDSTDYGSTEARSTEQNQNTIEGATVVNFKNEKNDTPPTGVVMNIAPYAAMILGAGAFAGVFLGRKKSEDEE